MLCPQTRLTSRVLLLVAALVASLATAHASFPGKNGRIAFVQGPDIYTMNPDGSDIRQLTAFSDDNFAFWENWSPDGKLLVFSRFPPPDSFGQLWLMNADGSNQHVLLDDPGYDDEAPSFSPDGSHLIFSRCGPLDGEFPCAIYRVNLDGSGLSQITPVRIELQDFESAYSPDGTTIAFGSFGRDGIIAAVHLMHPDGTRIRELSAAELLGSAPDWSPDGRRLIFTTKCCNPELPNLVIISRDGERVRQVTNDQGVIAAGRSSWSPQGDAIVFRSTNLETGENGIYIINADGTGLKLVRKVQPSAFMKHGPRARPQTHSLKNNKNKRIPPVTQIEDGGSLPRWGVAQ
jgi:Tol biopolymer transport system component